MRVLIVDDARWQRSHLQRLLTGLGHDVLQATNGAEGLDMLSNAPDLVVCDLLMPVCDGFQFLEAVRERGIAVPIIVASADIQRTSRERCLELGAKTFLSKPYGANDLSRALLVACPSEPEEKAC